MPGIDPDFASQLLKPDGLLSHNLKGFELRPQQIEMMRTVIQAYNDQAIALIEAGTGTGKSIAYLLPALLFAAKEKGRTVISTNTINLQEQLIKKDLPALFRTFDLNVKAVLVKGMGNYLCLRKMNDALQEKQHLTDSEVEELEQIEAWSDQTKEGCRSDLPFVPSYSIWDSVNAESDLCTQNQCPHYQQCPFFKARRIASDAQILVANHHLLFADLSIRAETENYEGPALLPPYQHIVIDEAHHIEGIASEYFASRVHYLGMIRTLARLSSERQTKSTGKLPLLKERLLQHYRNDPPQDIIKKLTFDLPALRKEAHQLVGEAFNTYFEFLEEFEIQEQKLRIQPVHHSHAAWNSRIVPVTKKLITSLYRYIHSINSLQNVLSDLEDEKIKNLLHDITSFSSRLTNKCEILEQFIQETIPENSVRWIEGQQMRSLTNIHLVEAKLKLAESMSEILFKPFSTVVMCSATLATNREFTYIRKRLGLTDTYLPDKTILEAIYDSSFNYQKQALLAVPSNICEPTHVDYPSQVQAHILKAVRCSRGNAFVLFTSYSMLQLCFQNLSQKLIQNRFFPLKQGDMNRDELLSTFRKTDRSVLFGTDSFWEGVDVAGEALRCVIIVRLPFQVPTEPLIQARMEAITAEGRNPFYDYSIPNAIVKFKQGFGRLIRGKKDRGCVLCLDSRLQTKNYGQLFLNSLPKCQRLFAPEEELYEKMEAFYKSTYYLVKN